MAERKQTATHEALRDAMEKMRAAGQLRTLVLADARGLAWSVAGELPSPDEAAAIPSLIARAFTDRQPLLRFYSDKAMRFEYRSDTLGYIKSSMQGTPAGADYDLDVPGEKDAMKAGEFVIAWDDAWLVLRHIAVHDETWCLLGVAENPVTARLALQKAAPGFGKMLNAITGEQMPMGRSEANDDALHTRMVSALDALRAAAPDIFMAAGTSKDGFVVAALDGDGVEPEMVAPLMGHSFLAIQESTERLCGATHCAMLRMEEGTLLARELTHDLLLTALMPPTACTGLILTAFEAAADALRAALDTTTAAAPAEPVSNGAEVHV
jgi:predicted regulator of Ras-like GTPase activity (Roadblock/LC7/MglB family)